MRKKYQVFISSTYDDLKEERKAVIMLLLKMGFIPVGMEQFPASNMEQMEYIKMMMDDCDYYLLILAGKYGTTGEDGISFTEKEYDYAIANGIPVMSVLVEDIEKLPYDKCEKTAEIRERLLAFRTKVSSNKLVDFYNDNGTLIAAVGAAVHSCVQNNPAKGWIRGEDTDDMADIKTTIESILEEHTISDADIDALFKENEIIFSCGDSQC